MKKFFLFLLIFTSHITCPKTSNNIELTVSGAQQTQMPLALIILDETDHLADIAHTIKKDLEFTQQFQVQEIHFSATTSKKQLLKDIKALFFQNIPLAICINANSKKNIEWRIYDTAQGTMIEGKKYKKRGTTSRAWAHAIADNTWTILTGNVGFFSSRIAYCKEFRTKKGTVLRKIYIADFDGSNEELLVDSSTVIVAPRWHRNLHDPLLFFSEYTNTNIRLVATDMQKNKKVTSNFDGVNMLPAFSVDGKAVVYCASHGNGNCQIYHYQKGKLQPFTNNTGNNVSPVFIDDNHICFCSDSPTKNPQIYIQNIKTGTLTTITNGGYCTSPNYCSANNTLVYHKMVDGIMQLFLYNCATKSHSQITKKGGNKHEASWSPCGTQLLFADEYAMGKSRIANLNLLTHKVTYLSAHNEYCSYPHWSPCYNEFPVISL